MLPIYESRRGTLLVSTDPALLDMNMIHGFLSTCFWSPGIPRPLLEKAISNSLNFGIYRTAPDSPPTPIGFARMITDCATYAYLCDVFILEAFRGDGAGKFLMRAVLAHPQLQGLRRISLLTRDAHNLYAPLGFKNLADPTRYMESSIAAADLYGKNAT